MRDILESMSRSRGLVVDRCNPTGDLLLPPSGEEADLREYTALLDHYAVRLLLREVIRDESPEAWRRGRRTVERFCRPQMLDTFLARLTELGVVVTQDGGFPRPSRPVTSFGSTYEWYVARVLSERFSCPAGWGVRFGGMKAGGDHDVVALLGGRFLYMEVKTSPPKHVEQPEVTGFVRRLVDIAPDIAVFHEDTHLRMKDKIVPLMEAAFAEVRGEGRGRLRLSRLEREIFHLDSSIYVVNSKPDIKRNFEVVFKHHFKARSAVVRDLFKESADHE